MNTILLLLGTLLASVLLSTVILAAALYVLRKQIKDELVRRDERLNELVRRDERQIARFAKVEADLKREAESARRAEDNLTVVARALTTRAIREDRSAPPGDGDDS